MHRDGSPPPDRSRRRTRILAGLFTAGAHVLLFGVLFWPRGAPPAPPPEPPPLALSLIEATPPRPPVPHPDQSDAAQSFVRPAAPHPALPLLTFARSGNSDLLSESQIAGAASANGEGANGGGGCDMARAVQQALRRDPLVHAAVEDAHRLGKAVMLWNGDWVRSGGQDGKGLSAVREAIMWELAFAPKPCRNRQEHGLVLLTLADGNTRFAIGASDWRWSDLLGIR